jgi:hypothetical protein
MARFVIRFQKAEHVLLAVTLGSEVCKKMELLYCVFILAPWRVVNLFEKEIVILLDEAVAGRERGGSWTWINKGSEHTVGVSVYNIAKRHLLDIKIDLEVMFSDHIAVYAEMSGLWNSEIWHPFFATDVGRAWMRSLSRQTGFLVRADETQYRVRIYGRTKVSWSKDAVEILPHE